MTIATQNPTTDMRRILDLGIFISCLTLFERIAFLLNIFSAMSYIFIDFLLDKKMCLQINRDQYGECRR